MQSGEGGATRIRDPLRYLAVALVVYGAVGVAVHLRLLPLLTASASSWVGLPAPFSVPARWSMLAPIEAHYDGLPWLPWAAWLAGAALLTLRPLALGQAPLTKAVDSGVLSPRGRLQAALPLILLLALLLLGAYARMVELLPQSRGISQFPYDDEGVYAGASQLFLQGILPYRDYFFAHPPLAAISYAPALAYHFTAWGSPASFMAARFLSVAYSLVTLGLLFFIGRRLAGLWGGVIAGGLWALDGRVIEINRKVMLDGPMVLLSCGALLLYMWVRPSLLSGQRAGGPRKPLLMLAFVGLLAGMSALTKIAGAACLLAILFDLLWLSFGGRLTGQARRPRSLLRQLGGLFAGAAGAFVLFAGPFLVAAPAQFIREIIFFQLLRPSDGLIDVPSRIADLSATYTNALTPLFAAIGFVVITVEHATRGDRGEQPESTSSSLISTTSEAQSFNPTAWITVALWAFFSLLLFTYSRSFYSHYYIQLAAPLCLLGAGSGLLPGLIRRIALDNSSPVRWAQIVPVGLLLVVAAPLVAVEWNGANSRHEDRIFEIVGRYVSDAVPPGTEVLTTDEQFNFLAARPPSRNATGYLIDSYGHMISLGLGLNTRDWGDLLRASLGGEHGNDAYAVMESTAPQADFLDRAAGASLIVLHQKGLPRLTQATIAAIDAKNKAAVREPRYVIYRGASR